MMELIKLVDRLEKELDSLKEEVTSLKTSVFELSKATALLRQSMEVATKTLSRLDERSVKLQEDARYFLTKLCFALVIIIATIVGLKEYVTAF